MPSALPFHLLVPAALLVLAGAASAQYKVIGPDGKVTYTDRAPASADGRVVPLRERTPVAQPEIALPYELQQAANRYPVTLYVVTDRCEPCTAARQLLRQRGIPFSERTVTSNEDGDALQKLSGGREAPTLTIGTQVLRGFAGDTWRAYLDAAGYPKESMLPAGWQPRPATPVVARASEPSRATGRAPVAPPAAAPAPVPPPAEPGAIRF